MQKSISRKLIGNNMLISVLVLVILETSFIIAVSQYYLGGIENTLLNNATQSATFYSRSAPAGSAADKANYIFENIDERENALVELLDLQGNVVIDNTGANVTETVDSYDYYQALHGHIKSWRGRNEYGESIISVSAPIYDDKEIVAVLRYVSSLKSAHKIIFTYFAFAVLIGLILIALAFALAIVTSKRIVIPIKELIRVTEEITMGNFKVTAVKYTDDEIGQLADAVNIMSKEIAKSDQEKNDFISSISHELRTPLTSIKGWGETLQDGGTEDEELLNEGLKIICHETDRLIILVNDLLDFSRLQSNRLEMHMQEMVLDDLLEEVYKQFSQRAKKEKINLQLRLEDDGMLILGDYNRLKQVFINIVDNAMKFTEGAKNAKIELQSYTDEDKIYVSITDNGSGISPEDLSKVKEKFYKGTSKKSGTGLGLSIATEIVHLHQGQLWIESVYGEGAQITIMLPLMYAVPDED